MKKNITILNKGLHTDNSLKNQPKGTYRFALNTVNETELGDIGYLGNEESNEACGDLSPGYTPIGKVYISGNKTVIFSVNGESSEIGVIDEACNYIMHVRGDLGFKITRQIDATYRLRLGCENTVYWVDGDNNKPMYYNLDAPEKFKTAGAFDKSKFELIKSYESIPIFEDISVINSGGQLKSGSYNIAIQYLDADFNTTEWVTVSSTINIYEDDIDNSYLEIRGSINSEQEFLNFPITTKAITVELSNLDSNFLFYRLAFIEATNGTGQISDIFYTDSIDINNTIFTYTGVNGITKGTEEEIQVFNNVIYSAEAIEQVENRLILAGTKGNDINFCELQKYASKIKTDLFTKKIFLNTLEDENTPKSPLVGLNGKGYMPGEIYSLGIVYLFEDGTVSPAYHIPGKSNNIMYNGENVSSQIVFSPDGGVHTHPMSTNNTSQNNTYIDNSLCSTNKYWGVDSEGHDLENTPVRHHRFPYRKDINLPLVVKESGTSSSTELYQVKLVGYGDLPLECQTTEDCESWYIRVTYKVDGVEEYSGYNISLDVASNPFDFEILSEVYSSNNITDIVVTVEDTNGDAVTHNLTLTTEIITAVLSSEDYIYSTEIFGLKFSNVELPPSSSTEGVKIVGYYIVRQDRGEEDKTILDSCALVPSIVHKKYISHGMLSPEMNYNDWKIKDHTDDSFSLNNASSNSERYSKRIFGMIHPEHKFREKKYRKVSGLSQQGIFEIDKTIKSKFRYRDVLDGTSYNSEHHRVNDGDGWSLKVLTRDSALNFKKRYLDYNFDNSKVEEIFYLNALESRDIKNDEGADLTIYNIAADNKIGFLQLKEDIPVNPLRTFPYVYLERELADNYRNYRSSPYYKISNNIETVDTFTTFGGDTYITPLRYSNTLFWDNRTAVRRGKTSWWKYALAAVLTVAAVFLAVASSGTGVVVSKMLLGLAVGALGGAYLMTKAGIDTDNWNKAYGEEYEKGLRETALDGYTSSEFKYARYANSSPNGYSVYGPEDDEIQWLGETVTDLWFESQVNTSLRHRMSEGSLEYFLDAPGVLGSGNTSSESSTLVRIPGRRNNTRAQNDVRLNPTNKVDKYYIQKLTFPNKDRGDGKEFIPPIPEFYEVNEDFHRMNTQKVYPPLGIEYNCCSECQEDFPHRVVYSQQSFQEELTDNFRVFLPNNYRDIEGESGEITDLFKIKNNLYIHTEENLWHLPQTFQERITGDIVSFIGTGSYFSVPPRKIVDTFGSSGGSKHKWATLKTKHGVFFISENERKIYQFTGNELKPISDIGMTNWYKENTQLKSVEEYYYINKKEYPFNNNPSNPYGVGFISTYDTKKERVLFTKKDNTLSEEILGYEDFELCLNGETITVFPNITQTIADHELLGETYVGIENCRLKFKKSIFTTTLEDREIVTTIPNTADIHVFYDTSGSFDHGIEGSGFVNGQDLGPTLGQIQAALYVWVAQFTAETNWQGTLYEYYDSTERWLNYPTLIGNLAYPGQGLNSKDLLVLSFCNESATIYHDGTLDVGGVNFNGNYQNDYNYFTGTIYQQYRSFIGIHYPIVFPIGQFYGPSTNFVLHSLAALKGTDYTLQELDALNVNPAFNTNHWSTLRGSLTNNGYNVLGHGLEDFGWLIKEDRFKNGNTVITNEQFTEDINTFLADIVSVETIEVEVLTEEVTYTYVDGVVLSALGNLNNSWTMSYSLKNNNWVSWHSYLPNFYYEISENFYSWRSGDKRLHTNSFWRHNKIGNYQTFYGEYHPHIIEYVSNSTPLQTRVWENLKWITEAKKYTSNMDNYTEERFITFNKGIFYNSRQCSGELELGVKDIEYAGQDYLMSQVINSNNNEVIIDKNEGDWSLNDLRDIRVNYSTPIWNYSKSSVQSEYYIDKVLNTSSLNVLKDWSTLESFRDKYLVIRLIFDNFADIKLITNYSVENEQESFR